MYKFRFIFIMILTALCFSACQDKQEIINPHHSDLLNPGYLDAIKKMDSLSYSERLKDPKSSVSHANLALKMASILNTADGFAIAYAAKANSFHPFEKDSAYLYLNRALKISDSPELQNRRPAWLYNLALLFIYAQNNRSAIFILDSSLKMAERMKDYSTISLAYNELGNIHFHVKDTAGARLLYDSALRIARQHHLFREMGISLGSLAYLEKDPEKTIQISKRGVSFLQKIKNTDDGLVDLYINIGCSFRNPDSAIFYYDKALALAIRGNLVQEQIAIYNNLAYSYLEKKAFSNAGRCLIEFAMPLARKMNNLDWQATLYDTYADVLTEQSAFKEAVTYQKLSIKTRREADLQTASGQIRLLDAMLELNDKELTIQLKNQQIEVHLAHERSMKYWLAITSLMMLVMIILLLFIRSKNLLKTQRLKNESARRILEIEEKEKGKISMELHDITGQFMVEIRGKMESVPFPDPVLKEEIMNEITGLSDQIRTISHRMNRKIIERFDLVELVSMRCQEVQKQTGLKIQLSCAEMQIEIKNETKIHVYRIFQELLTNAVKYARDSKITVHLAFTEKKIILKYSDDGQGFNLDDAMKNGMGLSNIFERTRLLGGKASLDTVPGHGVDWEINIPLGN